ncbi:hypothetical protein NEOLI_004127 [Neolecta irregularis DAH-3]|uniref:Uncharacterized protein n=1 Tax=Neolecta irregularis (strain DAH-3) TaxID=1198029 RepID=A0A1U7LSZ8_NEOID|nr:hypothetical protein NEOLI_004127 [Neolecta irregularis DAH-3]|eukprot:OLL25795.1 hypothetical protein NEOLI_004127 [Neolecta irregularis DAH-3]
MNDPHYPGFPPFLSRSQDRTHRRHRAVSLDIDNDGDTESSRPSTAEKIKMSQFLEYESWLWRVGREAPEFGLLFAVRLMAGWSSLYSMIT